jgi:N6-L-threonylcarbamoyladenine synthase
MNKLYLAIESSCDETSLAILQGQARSYQESEFYDYVNSFRVLASLISSQIDIHAEYGGVIPEIGARQHAQNIHPLFLSLLKQLSESQNKADVNVLDDTELHILSRIEKIFVTTEPGLISALRVGMEFAKTLQFYIKNKLKRDVDIVSVNHLKGHVLSSFYNLNTVTTNGVSRNLFPHLHLLVSGGNTQIILLKSPTEWEIVGQTLDDAAGECLDKIGRMLGLPYPGGVYLAKIAKSDTQNYLNFPIGMRQSQNLNYSFSGLKTAVRYYLQDLKMPEFKFEQKIDQQGLDILLSESKAIRSEKFDLIYKTCVSTQKVVVDQLINKLEVGVRDFKPLSIGVSGGVSANILLRSEIFNLQLKYSLEQIFLPPLSLTGDNAVMIAIAGLVDFI